MIGKYKLKRGGDGGYTIELLAPANMEGKTFQREIDACHPMSQHPPDAAIDADLLAMKLVGERHEKRELVNLVRWLILRNVELAEKSSSVSILTATPSLPSCLRGKTSSHHE
ncbi:MAG TPA: hypothetical protein VF614_16930 [Chthoniobacteraceae bacterium]|jgi:hypothetical protein